MKRWFPLIAAVLVVAGVATASSIHSWSSGEVINAADLNAAFNHIHSTMVGGHGARLVNSDISASAAITHSKMATPALLPKAWVQAGGGAGVVCSSSPCTVAASSGVSGVTRASTGKYTVTWTATRANAAYAVICSCQDPDGLLRYECSVGSALTSSIVVKCTDISMDAGVNTAVDAVINVLLMDNDN